jgi:hypothetical protein
MSYGEQNRSVSHGRGVRRIRRPRPKRPEDESRTE